MNFWDLQTKVPTTIDSQPSTPDLLAFALVFTQFCLNSALFVLSQILNAMKWLVTRVASPGPVQTSLKPRECLDHD